jgi:hypothetical protein
MFSPNSDLLVWLRSLATLTSFDSSWHGPCRTAALAVLCRKHLEGSQERTHAPLVLHGISPHIFTEHEPHKLGW